MLKFADPRLKQTTRERADPRLKQTMTERAQEIVERFIGVWTNVRLNALFGFRRQTDHFGFTSNFSVLGDKTKI